MVDAESESEEDISSDEEEEEQEQPAQAYLSLMKSLAESAPHKAKRRKLDHASAEETTQPEPEAESSIPVNKDGEEDPDMVEEEPEEDAEDAAPEDLFDEDDEVDAEDPFELHFESPKDEIVQPKLKSIKEGDWKTQRIIENFTRIQLSTPGAGESEEKPLPPITGVTDLKLKKKLNESFAPKHPAFNAIEQTIAPLLFNYRDLLYCNRTVAGGQSVRRMACLHALNHIFK